MTALSRWLTISFIILIMRHDLARLAVIEDDELKYFLVNIANLNGHICMGSYIEESWVLTTASCATLLTHSIGDTKLFIGDSQVGAKAAVQTYAKEVIIHPNYNMRHNTNNIALVKLESAFDQTQTGSLRDTNVVVSLATSASERKNCALYGWSYQSFYGGSSVNTNLMDSGFTVVSEDDCVPKLKQAGRIAEDFLKDQMMCGRDHLCISEDGAPLVCNNQLHGLLSATYCTVAILERIDYYEPWIRSTMYDDMRTRSYSVRAKLSHLIKNIVLIICLLA